MALKPETRTASPDTGPSWEHVPAPLQWLVIAAIIIASCVTIYSKFLKPVIWGKLIEPIMLFLKHGRETFNKIDKHDSTLTRLEKQVLEIHHQVNPNSGFSLFDKISRTDSNVAVLTLTQRASDSLDDVAKYQLDPAGRIIFVNRAWCRMVGMHYRDALGRGWLSAVPDEDRERVIRDQDLMVKEHLDFTGEFYYKNPEGGKLKTFIQMVWMRDGQDRVLGAYATVRPFVEERTDRRKVGT